MTMSPACDAKITGIAVLNWRPIQYFAPLYAYLNAEPELEVTARYLSDFLDTRR